jgi:LPS sulfotransferase NodH
LNRNINRPERRRPVVALKTSLVPGSIHGKTLVGTPREGNRRPVLFIVFGHQRTGSTLVTSKLNSHSRIVCYEEVFLPWADSEPSLREWLKANGRPQWFRAVPSVRTLFLNTICDANSLPDYVGAIGFKIMYDQMSLWPTFAYLAPKIGRLFQDRALRRWLSVNNVVIVHTLRRNHLKVLVSHQLAGQSGRFHSRDPAGNRGKVVIPLRGLKARLRRIEAAERVAYSIIRGLPTIEIIYEDYIGGGGVEQDANLCTALGQTAPERGLSSSLNKVSSDDLRDTVANYDQVVACLLGTPFERFLA